MPNPQVQAGGAAEAVALTGTDTRAQPITVQDSTGAYVAGASPSPIVIGTTYTASGWSLEYTSTGSVNVTAPSSATPGTGYEVSGYNIGGTNGPHSGYFDVVALTPPAPPITSAWVKSTGSAVITAPVDFDDPALVADPSVVDGNTTTGGPTAGAGSSFGPVVIVDLGSVQLISSLECWQTVVGGTGTNAWVCDGSMDGTNWTWTTGNVLSGASVAPSTGSGSYQSARYLRFYYAHSAGYSQIHEVQVLASGVQVVAPASIVRRRGIGFV